MQSFKLKYLNNNKKGPDTNVCNLFTCNILLQILKTVQYFQSNYLFHLNGNTGTGTVTSTCTRTRLKYTHGYK